MRRFFKIAFCAAIVMSLFLSCAGTTAAKDSEAKTMNSTASFTDVEGKEWQLSEITSTGKNIIINRQKYETNFMGAYFSISFMEESPQEGRIGGTGAPNRFFGPYTLEGSRGLSIGTVANTLMVAFNEPDELKEREYFAYISEVTRWDLADGKLRLYSINKEGSEAILIFITE